jgi:hypothetical protein
MSKKGNPDFKPMTDQQREEAHLKRLADQEYAVNHLIIEYKDADYWRSLASEQGLKMPNWWIKGVEAKYIRRACKKLGIDVAEYVESTGFKNLKEFTENNEKWTAFAHVGLVLEFYKENTAQKGC